MRDSLARRHGRKKIGCTPGAQELPCAPSPDAVPLQSNGWCSNRLFLHADAARLSLFVSAAPGSSARPHVDSSPARDPVQTANNRQAPRRAPSQTAWRRRSDGIPDSLASPPLRAYISSAGDRHIGGSNQWQSRPGGRRRREALPGDGGGDRRQFTAPRPGRKAAPRSTNQQRRPRGGDCAAVEVGVVARSSRRQAAAS